MKNLKRNIQILILAIGVVMVWRGTWGLLDTFLFPNHHVLSYILSFFAGVLLLYSNDRKLDELTEH